MVSLHATYDPRGKLDPQPWLEAEATQRVIAALRAEGGEIRFIGGCVRDSLAHRPVKDIDIATPDEPETVIRLLKNAGLKAVPTGIEHGTVTAVVDGKPFEITTLRVDVKTDGRHATVAFTDDWIADAGRRDFTFNALSATPEGDVYDYYDGIPDLAHGRVRFIGRAEERVREDYLRILRYFRFHAYYGRSPADVDALAACRKYADRLETLAPERVREELLRTLLAPDPADAMLLMRNERVLEHLLPEATNIGRLRSVVWLATRAIQLEGVEPDAIRHLAALLSGGAEAAVTVAARLRLSNAETDRLVSISGSTAAVRADLDATGRRRVLHAFGAAHVRDQALLAWAEELAIRPKLPHKETEGWIALLEECAKWQEKHLPITGDDVMARGIPHGPDVGEYLRRVEDWWVAKDFAPDRDACLKKLDEAIIGKKRV